MATRKRRANGKSAATAPTATGEREQRELECTLSDAEFNARSDSMADCELTIERLKEQRKGLNGEIAAAATERARLAHVIERRIETRMVECAWMDDFPKNVKRLIRQDTGAEVDTRPMTGSDRQVGLALPPVDEEAATLPPARRDAEVVQLEPAKRKRGRPRKAPEPSGTNTIHAH
jgi:hypothetical protein